MNISQNGVNLIKGFEGFRNKAYKPVTSEQYYTIGFGHYGADVKANEVITEGQAENMLKNDLRASEDAVNSLVHVPLNQNQYDSLVSFCFNVGINAFRNSTLLQCLNAKNYHGASNEFGKWIHDGGKVIQGLVNRRKQEEDLFNKSVPVVKQEAKETPCPCCGKC